MAKKGKVDAITEKTNEFAGSGVEVTKAAPAEEPEVVRGEQVIKKLREKGHAI